ncbi:MAG: zinc ribbon domain-containing protein, partial [Candidatus Nanopelagicaceae bacterium]
AKTLPVLEKLEQAERGRDAHRDLAIAGGAERSDVEAELRRAESDVEQVVGRIEKDQKLIDSGTVSAKDLENLLGELKSLGRRKEELEEVELEVMVRLEEINARITEHSIERDRFESEANAHAAERDKALAEIDSARTSLLADRQEIESGISKELIELYLKVRELNGGVGAAKLENGQCLGCHLQINAVEVTRIKALPDDEVVRCDECRRILVRI